MWDLVHDRTHMHGDLPFDPFMIKQRMPYCLYSLEELRCDLTAFREATSSSRREGFSRRTRHECSTRSSSTAFSASRSPARACATTTASAASSCSPSCTSTTSLHWTDNRLTIDWDDGRRRRARAVRTGITTCTRDGIERPKTAHWPAAYDLVATYVPPATGSRWVAGVRDLPPRRPPRARTVDEVMDDEFPLSLFYDALARKLNPPGAGGGGRGVTGGDGGAAPDASNGHRHSAFTSDNYAGAHPRVLEALIEANRGHTPAYGADPWSERTRALMREQFGPQSQSFLVFNGTGANVLCIRAACTRWRRRDLRRHRPHQRRRGRRPRGDRPALKLLTVGDARRQAHPRPTSGGLHAPGRRAPGPAAARVDHAVHRARHLLPARRDRRARRPRPPARAARSPRRRTPVPRRGRPRRCAARAHARGRSRPALFGGTKTACSRPRPS